MFTTHEWDGGNLVAAAAVTALLSTMGHHFHTFGQAFGNGGFFKLATSDCNSLEIAFEQDWQTLQIYVHIYLGSR